MLQPSPSPLRSAGSDPWMVLDSSTTKSDAAALEDASVRFPALDAFSLLHDSGSKFAFDPKSEIKKQPSRDISQRVTEALADDAFAKSKSKQQVAVHSQSTPNPQSSDVKIRLVSQEASKPKAIPSITTQQPTAQRMGYVSTGTMTSPSPPSPTSQSASASNRPVFRFPASSDRSSSQPRASDHTEVVDPNLAGQQRPRFLDHRSRSQILTFNTHNSSQPSPEGGHRSSYLSGLDSSIHRSKSANAKTPRPTSVQAPAKPNLLRRLSRERSNSRPIEEQNHEPRNASHLVSPLPGEPDAGEEAIRIDSNVDFLKAKEEEDQSKRKDKRLSSGSRHIKRASMPSVSLSGTKNLLAGRFGDAFKRFETNTGGDDGRDSSHSPVHGANDLTPIAGSEATDGRSDDGMEESQEVPPEMRRELERRRLSQEEKRVADAAAAYKQRLADSGGAGRGRPAGSNNKAASIQSKVQSLLDESGRGSPSPTKTAFGYGRFTDTPEQQVVRPPRTSSRQVPIQTSSNLATSQLPPRSRPHPDNVLPPTSRPNPSVATQPPASILPHYSAPPSERPIARPPGGPPPKPQTKPQNLRTGDRPPQSPAKPSTLNARKPMQQSSQQQNPLPAVVSEVPNDDWETNFSKRYPDLAGLEMVETEIDSGASGTNTGQVREMRIRDV